MMVPNSMMYPSPEQDNALSLMEASATLSETSGKPTGTQSMFTTVTILLPVLNVLF